MMTFWKWVEFHLVRKSAALVFRLLRHPLPPGQIFSSPGGTFKYKVIGPVCQLYDRASLPYPCCRLFWRGKEPSWRRVGKRFVPDIGAKMSPSYCVQLLNYPSSQPVVKTLYWMRLTPTEQEWWYSRRLPATERGCAQLLHLNGAAV